MNQKVKTKIKLNPVALMTILALVVSFIPYRAAFAGELARMGVHRVCPIGQMQRPPLSWHHDGRPNLADLVQWTDFE